MSDLLPTSDHLQPLTPSGILIIDKPTGWTSHDIVAKIRKIFNTKKVGHAGTLDPMATGVLVVLIGKATKLSDQLLSEQKTYQAEITFGQQTDTADADGTVIAVKDASHLTAGIIQEAIPPLLGTREQRVPAYSAVKINGQKLYQLTRRHKTLPPLPTRAITIYSLTLDSFTPAPNHNQYPKASFSITCSKGTYIRVLAEELAEQLSTVAHLTALRRISSGNLSIDQAITIETLQQSQDPTKYLIPIQTKIAAG